MRDHSPYCEATGPIVGEGFVAARVQAIQGSENVTRQRRSHSPMTPCPIPRWLQIYEPITPPKSTLTSKSPIATGGRDFTRGSERPPPYYRKSKPSPLATSTVHLPSTDVAAVNTSQDESVTEEKIILSPQAIPPGLAKPSYTCSFPRQREEHYHSSMESGRSLRPGRSVADKLGSLVDRGWVGCDVFGRAYNEQHASEPCTPTSHVREKGLASRNRSHSEGSREEVLPLKRHVHPNERMYAREEFQRSTEKDNSVFDEHNPGLVRYTGQRKRTGYDGKNNTGKNADVHFCSSEAYEEGLHYGRTHHSTKEHHLRNPETYKRVVHDATAQHSTKKHRAWTLHHPDCSRNCRSQRIQLRTLSLSQEIDRHLSEWQHAGSPHTEEPKQPTNAPTHSEQTSCPSPVPSPAQSSRLSSATTQQSKQSGTGAVSWLPKLAGYKLVLVDKNPIIRELSRRTSEPAMNTRRLQHQHAGLAHNKHGAISMAHIPADRGKEYGAEDFSLPNGVKSLCKSQEEQKPAGQCLAEEPKNGSSTIATTYDTDAPSAPASRKSSAQTTPPPPRRRSDTQVTNDLAQREKKRSTPSPETRQSTKQSSASSKIASTIMLVQDTSEPMSTHSMNEHVLTEDITASPQRQSPETVSHSFRAQTPSTLPPIDEHPNESPQSVHWETAGRGIKSVQVIVSLDGADDLIVKAKLLRRPKRDSLAVRSG